MFEQFFNTIYQPVPGASVRLKVFVGEFHAWLIQRGGNPDEWHPSRIAKELEAAGFPVGFTTGGKVIGNLSRVDRITRWEKLAGPKQRLRKSRI